MTVDEFVESAKKNIDVGLMNFLSERFSKEQLVDYIYYKLNRRRCEHCDTVNLYADRMAEGWVEHQKTKFTGDGAHFAADVKMNQAVEEYRAFRRSNET